MRGDYARGCKVRVARCRGCVVQYRRPRAFIGGKEVKGHYGEWDDDFDVENFRAISSNLRAERDYPEINDSRADAIDYLINRLKAAEARHPEAPAPEALPPFDGQSINAQDWAKAFCARNPWADEGNMIGWFANAIMRGHDTAFAALRSADAGVKVVCDGRASVLCAGCGEREAHKHHPACDLKCPFDPDAKCKPAPPEEVKP